MKKTVFFVGALLAVFLSSKILAGLVGGSRWGQVLGFLAGGLAFAGMFLSTQVMVLVRGLWLLVRNKDVETAPSRAGAVALLGPGVLLASVVYGLAGWLAAMLSDKPAGGTVPWMLAAGGVFGVFLAWGIRSESMDPHDLSPGAAEGAPSAKKRRRT